MHIYRQAIPLLWRQSDMVKFWISPLPSCTLSETCHFWNSKSIYSKVCLTELRNLRWSMPCLGFWKHVGFSCSSYWRLKCCSHRECFVLKASCALISHFRHCFCSSWADGNPLNRLGIVWGNPPLPWAYFVLQYADGTTCWPNTPNMNFTSLLYILRQLHNYQFASCNMFLFQNGWK
jgi:hypothetical protein